MLKIISALLLLFTTSACNEYWWTRGQAPSPEELLNRATSRVSEIHSESNYKREDIFNVASNIIQAVSNSSQYSQETLNLVDSNLKTLEGKLSYGNRAPYNELYGQLRNFKKDSELTSKTDPLRLYFARILFFLSSELKVPAPDAVANS